MRRRACRAAHARRRTESVCRSQHCSCTRGHRRQYSRTWLSVALAAAGLTVLHAVCLAAAEQLPPRPLIIAHRGSPCILPEETLAGYEAAIDAGVDFVEMDAVSTKDGVLVARHGLTLDDSTDVASRPEFAARHRTQVPPNGQPVTGFFTSDFTLAEVRTLWATQALPSRDASHNREHRRVNGALRRVPTIAEVLRLVRRRIWAGSAVGAYVETKEPAFHVAKGLGLERKLMTDLMESGFQLIAKEHVVLQSFDVTSLENLSVAMLALGIGPAPLVWLLDCIRGAHLDHGDLHRFATYGQVLAPDKGLLEDLQPDGSCGPASSSGGCGMGGQTCAGRLGKPLQTSPAADSNSSVSTAGGPAQPPGSAFMEMARHWGLSVHPWTLRQEAQFVPLDFGGHMFLELDYLAGPGGLGVQGVIGDCPAALMDWSRSLQWADGNRSTSVFAASGVGASWVDYIPTTVPSWEAALTGFAAMLVLVAALIAAIMGVRWYRSRHRYEAFFDHPPEAAQYAARGAVALEALTPAPSMLAKHASLQLTVIPLAESPGGTARGPGTARGGGELAFGLPLYSPLDPRAAN